MKSAIHFFSLLFFFIFNVLAKAQEQPARIESSLDTVDDYYQITVRDIPEIFRAGLIDHQEAIVKRDIPFQLPIDGIDVIATFTILNDPVDDLDVGASFNIEQNTDNILQPIIASPMPSLTFNALPDSLTVIPPDTQGTVGLNHIMTTLNDRIRIQSKTGIVLRTILARDFWKLSAPSYPFDPKIAYDPFSNKWIFTALTNPRQTTSTILLAISQTDDPLGAWNIYRIAADVSALSWADFPSLGFNSKWIVVQTNMFNISNNSFNRSQVLVFNKAQLYTGGTLIFRRFSLINSGGTQAPAVTLDNANPNLYLLQSWNGNAAGNGYLALYRLSGAVGAETLVRQGLISVAAPWASSHPLINGGFAPQLGTLRRIMNGDARILSVTFRNGSIWAAQTVFLPATSPTHSAIQWWQISPAGSVPQFGRIEDITASLNVGNFFAYPSIAVNSNNDVLLGYSVFTPLIYASSAYSLRKGTDFANSFRGMEIFKPGVDVYTKDFGTGIVRWGDYSSTVVDPNGTDFWTLQESADTRLNISTTRWTTWWAKVVPPAF